MQSNVMCNFLLHDHKAYPRTPIRGSCYTNLIYVMSHRAPCEFIPLISVLLCGID